MRSHTIKTKYYVGKDYANPVKINSGSNANKAVATCIMHMQINQYGANVAEVYDDATGELHAQIKHKMSGNIEIIYKRDPLQFEARLAVGALFQSKK